MKFLKMLLLLNLLSWGILAKEQSYQFKDFDEAKKSEEFLTFVGESTKFKIITTEFTGFAKKFSLNFDLKENIVKNILVVLDAKSLDTDNSSRNDKLYSLCLKVDQFPTLKITIDQPVTLLDAQEGEVQAKLTVLDKNLTRTLKYKIQKLDSGFKVSFSTDLSIAESGMEDPSIAIAKVDDRVQIQGSIIFRP
jgi:polyisoprenoid-binding protein YceI